MPFNYSRRLLSQIAVKIRAERSLKDVPPSYFTQVSPKYADIWFPTAGCTWDAMGHCTTCNYGVAPPVSPEQMYGAVEAAVTQLLPTTELIWVSAFNTLFSREVPDEARRRIFRAIATTGAQTVVTETHPVSVKKDVIRECVEILNGRTFGVELGVETMNEFVRFACLNKPFSNKVLDEAIATIHAGGAIVYANLLVGIPFLSEAEVIEDMSTSVIRAHEAGCDQVVLFPNHVKRHTIAWLLAEAGRYEPPDAWTLRAIVARVPEEIWPKINFAWLELKNHPGAAEVGHEPDRERSRELLSLLNGFSNSKEPELLHRALALQPPREVPRGEASTLLDRLASDYEWLAQAYAEPGWWSRHGEATSREIAAAYEQSGLVTAR